MEDIKNKQTDCFNALSNKINQMSDSQIDEHLQGFSSVEHAERTRDEKINLILDLEYAYIIQAGEQDLQTVYN